MTAKEKSVTIRTHSGFVQSKEPDIFLPNSRLSESRQASMERKYLISYIYKVSWSRKLSELPHTTYILLVVDLIIFKFH